jgi:hypothetical protein
VQQGDDFHASGPSAHPDEPEHVPANRRPSLDWAHKLRGHLEDHAWHLLFVSILAFITQLCLRIVNDGRLPPMQVVAQDAARVQELAIPGAIPDSAPGLFQQAFQRLLRWRPQGRVAELPGAGTAASNSLTTLPTGCSQYDELCHSRMLYFADAVSYDHDTSLFYTVLKDWVLYMIFMASLYSFSYVGLRRYQRRRWTSDTTKSRDDKSPSSLHRRTWSEDDAVLLEDDGVPFALCALAVAVALGSVLLVPMTVLDGLLRKHLSSEDLYGGLTAHTDLGFIWQNLFYVSTFCHFLVLPFAFLYTESEGLELERTAATSAGRKVLSRLRETSVTLALVLALVALLVQVLDSLHVPLMQQERLTLSYVVTAMLGSIIFLVLVPFGFEGVCVCMCVVCVVFFVSQEFSNVLCIKSSQKSFFKSSQMSSLASKGSQEFSKVFCIVVLCRKLDSNSLHNKILRRQ